MSVCPVCHVGRPTMSSWSDALTELFSDKRRIDGRRFCLIHIPRPISGGHPGAPHPTSICFDGF